MEYSKLKECERFLFDMDGTLYLGDDVYPGARELMEALPALGKRYIYLTSNSSRAANEKNCAVGDRLYTDIAAAQNASAVPVLVLSGETTPEMAAAVRQPDYTLPSVKELLEALC